MNEFEKNKKKRSLDIFISSAKKCESDLAESSTNLNNNG